LEIESKTKPSLAFAGVGWIGRNRMQAAIDSASAEISLVTDPSAECVAEALKMAPTSRAAASFEDAISDPDIDGIVIATPSALHMEQAVLAFQHQKAVFCQKPLGRNAEEVANVIAAASAANRLLGADFSYRYTAAFQKILTVISSGELGKIFAVDLKFHNAYGPDKAWFYDIKQSGGGCVLDLGIHLIDLMLYALDFPAATKVSSSLYGKGVSVKGKDEVEDYANISIELANDVNAQLSCSWNLQAGQEAVIEASFYGTNGGVAMKNLNGSFYDFAAYRYWGTKSEVLVNPPDAWGGRALTDWIQRLAVSPNYDVSAQQYLPSAEILDRVYGRS
jgi:predicted dehydrogenase